MASAAPSTSGSSSGASASSTSASSKHVPKLVAFDLDATLWEPEMYELMAAPSRSDGGKIGRGVFTKHGEEITLYDDVCDILVELHTDDKWSSTKVAYASRTSYPEYAHKVMGMMKVSSKHTMNHVVDFHQIYPGNKKAHFSEFRKDSGIEYEDMIFFDNEKRNCRDVATLGVLCVHTPYGLTKAKWQSAIEAFAKRKRAASSSGKAGGKKKGKTAS